jgi:very-short-patch-repair endonuclease
MDREETRRRARRLRNRMTKAETVLWTRLKGRSLYGWRFRRQHPIGPYIADFACRERMIVVEIDGATHAKADELQHDARRTAFMEERGWSVMRFWNREIYENLEGVVASVALVLPPTGPRNI